MPQRIKNVTYNVQCAYDQTHTFQYVFKVEEGSEEITTSDVEAFCPHCEKNVRITIQGKVALDEKLMRNFKV